ncbi:MAG TPA: HupE/UreJ family protein [Gemmatimonadaceae bacterium]|nr:HupE/UreJ family protein [Gemmatimonadaceae bacterium]
MSELAAYLQLGFRHITDLRGADHILFLLALAAIYRFRDWRECLWVATAFTAGHSLTLALAVTNVLTISPRLIEFLIPITIVATGLENLLVRDNATPFATRRYRPVLAGVFGLVHGAGFANYLRSLFVERIALPLFGFNVGIELGQICVLALAFAAFGLVDRLITAARPSRLLSVAPVRLRAVAVSSLVLVVAARWAVERAPW